LKTAFITGITGQDGSYLAELLLNKGYKVIGLKRRTSLICTDRIDQLFENENFKLEYFELNDVGSIYRLLLEYKPDEFYNLAAQSHVKVSFEVPETTVDGIAMGTLRILEAIRNAHPACRFYQASSSEMFGDNPAYPYNEESRFMPASPYANAKVFAHNLMRNYRKSYDLFCCSGILFNHESPRRGETFVTRKITIGAAKIALGLEKELRLGNLDSYRDWGFAGDYVEAMWLMLQQDKPDDYVIATGKTYSVREFCELVFQYASLGDYRNYVIQDPKYFRPHEVPYLLGNAAKAKKELGWEPKTDIKQLVEMMYNHDFNRLKNEILTKRNNILS
jgi:GDPmannose 4,6-dehydratase